MHAVADPNVLKKLRHWISGVREEIDHGAGWDGLSNWQARLFEARDCCNCLCKHTKRNESRIGEMSVFHVSHAVCTE
jgi:hypothetical protein